MFCVLHVEDGWLTSKLKNEYFRKYYHLKAFFMTFSKQYTISQLLRIFSLTNTMFEVLDGVSLSHRFRKKYH